MNTITFNDHLTYVCLYRLLLSHNNKSLTVSQVLEHEELGTNPKCSVPNLCCPEPSPYVSVPQLFIYETPYLIHNTFVSINESMPKTHLVIMHFSHFYFFVSIFIGHEHFYYPYGIDWFLTTITDPWRYADRRWAGHKTICRMRAYLLYINM